MTVPSPQEAGAPLAGGCASVSEQAAALIAKFLAVDEDGYRPARVFDGLIRPTPWADLEVRWVTPEEAARPIAAALASAGLLRTDEHEDEAAYRYREQADDLDEAIERAQCDLCGVWLAEHGTDCP